MTGKAIRKGWSSPNARYKGVFGDSSGLYKVDKDKEKTFIARAINMPCIATDIDTGETKGIIEYEGVNGRGVLELDRNEYLNPESLIKYQNKGLDIMRDTATPITQHLRNQEEIAEHIYVHSKLGYGTHKDKEVYKLHKSIGVDSTYKGKYEIEPKGDYQRYLDMLDREVRGNPKLELILVCGLVPVVQARIAHLMGIETLQVHIKGQSSKGKTTAVKLAIASFACPDVKKTSLITTFNTTQNALIKQIEGLNGVPFAFDEISTATWSDFTRLIYNLTNGTDKARLTCESELRERATWLTLILFTGERSLLKSAKQNNGLKVRVIELEEDCWTSSATNADNILETINQNYGHLGMKFAEMVIQMKQEELVALVEEGMEEMRIKLQENGIGDDYTERRLKNFGLITATAGLVGKMLGKCFDIEGISKVLMNAERESIKTRTFDKVVIDHINEYVNRNIGKFIQKGNSLINQNVFWGTIDRKADYIEIAMMKTEFETMLRDGGFEDKNVVLKELKEGGYLDHDSDRNTRSRLMPTGTKLNVYVIKLPK